MIPLINPFPFSVGNLPDSYNESLSYLQKLMVFQKKLNECITNLNEITNIVNNYDFNLNEINKKIDDLNNDFIIFENRITNNVTAQLQNNYNQIVNLMNDYHTIFNSDLTNLQINLENQIREIELGNVEAYNPTSGAFENVSKVIMDVYSILRNNAISCAEFDGLELSATEYDALEITAYSFDIDGKTILITT